MLLVMLISSTQGVEMKESAEKSGKYKYITILENSVKRKINVLRVDSKIGVLNVENTDNRQGLILSFKDISEVSIAEFEAKYDLKLKTKLVIGYYIFENKSSKSDVEIVGKIIENEANIKTVKPNWKMQNITR